MLLIGYFEILFPLIFGRPSKSETSSIMGTINGTIGPRYALKNEGTQLLPDVCVSPPSLHATIDTSSETYIRGKCRNIKGHRTGPTKEPNPVMTSQVPATPSPALPSPAPFRSAPRRPTQPDPNSSPAPPNTTQHNPKSNTSGGRSGRNIKRTASIPRRSPTQTCPVQPCSAHFRAAPPNLI